MRRRVRAMGAAGARATALALILLLTAGLGLDVLVRWTALPVSGGNLVAQWGFTWLAFATLPSLLDGERGGPSGAVRAVCAGFAVGVLALGLALAAARIGGVEPILGLPVAWRFAVGAGLAAGALAFALTGPGAAWFALGAAGAVLLPPLPPLAGIAVFAAALVARVPVALALVAAVAIAPGPLGDAALAQTVVRGLSPAVLLAVPLFVLAATLMVAGGIGEGIVSVAAAMARRRRTAAAEANVLTSLLFGGVSGSGIADAALGARLIAPAMVRAGYSAPDAAALTAASAVVPNLVPPSIALLLAAAATDQSVGALWVAGLGAGTVVAAALWAVVRLRPPAGTADPAIGRPDLWSLGPPAAIAVAVLGGLRLGLVTATEAGVVAVVLAAAYAAIRKGRACLLPAAGEAAQQTGRIALLIAAAAPVSFLLATSGVDWAGLLPDGPAILVLAAAVLVALAVGTVLDVGAAILLLLPILVPAAAAAGADPVHATLTLVTALLMGGLTPPVGILVVTVHELTGARGVFRAATPYLLALAAAVAVLAAVPALTAGLARLF